MKSIFLMIGVVAIIWARNATQGGEIPGRGTTSLPGQTQTAPPCCTITNIDSRSGVITARQLPSGQAFQFTAAPGLLPNLRVGQKVWVDQKTQMVSVEGAPNCCRLAQGGSAGGPVTTQLPFPLKALRISALEGQVIYGGNRVVGTVELNQPPGQNGVTVALESSDPQLAGVPPRVTVTGGVTSAETGPMYTARFDITTRPVQNDTTVIIRARAGVQTLEANLRIRRPTMKSASHDAPNICDGNNKGTVKYTLTGPAPSGLKVYASGYVRAPSGSSGQFSASETVTKGNSGGSMRTELPRCQAHNPNERCSIQGSARVEGGSGSSAQIGGSCGHPPD